MGNKSPAQRRRYRQRQAEKREACMTELRASGAACANCIHFERAKDPAMKGYVCDLHSGGGAFQIARNSGLCTDHQRRPS